MISFDLDMTLLDHNTGKITPSALEAIDILRKNIKSYLPQAAIWTTTTAGNTVTL